MVKTKVREKYRGLSRQELLDKAYEFGFNYERISHSCSQSLAAASCELLDIDDVVIRVTNSSCGGQAAEAVGTCGGLIGGTVILDYFFGRSAEGMSYQDDTPADMKVLMEGIGVSGLLYKKYIKEYGTILCPHIQAQLYGRCYYMLDPDESKKFNEAGAHSAVEDSCCRIVGTATRWVMEILLDKGAIEL